MARLAGDRFKSKIDGTTGADTIIGLKSIDRLSGGDGNDDLNGGSGADILSGGNGNDVLRAYYEDLGDDLDADRLDGGAGNDELHAGLNDIVTGGTGTDALYLDLSRSAGGLALDFTALLSGGTMTIGAGSLATIERLRAITLSDFADTLTIGNAANQSVTVEGRGGGDTINGSLGGDTIYAGSAGTFGFSFDDEGGTSIGGELDVDTINAGGGADQIYAGFGDNVDGGAGTDVIHLDYTRVATSLNINFAGLLSGGSLVVGGGTLRGLEQVASIYLSDRGNTIAAVTATTGMAIYGGAGADNLSTGSGSDQLFGSGFGSDDGVADTLSAGAGDDFVYAGLNDTALGGAGYDQISLDLSAAGSALTLNLSPLFTNGSLTIGAGTLSGFENLSSLNLSRFNDVVSIGGSAFSFTTVNGGAGSDTINGGIGFDYLFGNDDGVEQDTLRGGANTDYIFAGVNDIADGGAGTDTLSLDLSAATAGISLDLTAGFNGGTQAVAGGSFTGFEVVSDVLLTDFDDTLTVGALSNSGVSIVGGKGRDTITGGVGDDDIYGGGEFDFTEGLADDGVADILRGGAGNDSFTAGINDTVEGGTGLDTLRLDLRRAEAGLVFDLTPAFTGGSVTLFAGTLGGLEELDELYLSRFDDVVTIGGRSGNTEAGAGNDRVTGTSGVDTINGDVGDDALFGLAGNDELIGGAGSDRLEGGAGDDLLFGDFDLFDDDGNYAENVVGEANDILFGGTGSDEMHGGFGRDTAIYDDISTLFTRSYGGAHGTVERISNNDFDELDSIETLQFMDGVFNSYDEDSVHAEVARLYDSVLQRLPDFGGIDFHAGRIANGEATLLRVAEDFVNAPEFQAATGGLNNAGFVDFIYQSALGRPADPGGRAYWISQLDAGASRAQLVVQFSESPEHRALTQDEIVNGSFTVDERYATVSLIYDSALGRLPDRDGLLFWAEGLKNGTQSLTSLANGFAGSGEFATNTAGFNNAQLVDYMYMNTLNRPADAGGRDYWVARLEGGLTKAGLLLEFALTGEHRALQAPFIDDGIALG